MTKDIKLSIELLKSASAYALVQGQTISEQVEYSAEENPDLPLGFVK